MPACLELLRGVMLWVLLGLCTPVIWARANDAPPPPVRVTLSDHALVCEDPGGQLTIQDIVQGRCHFSLPGSPGMARGLSASAWWLQIRVPPTPQDPQKGWLLSIGHPRLQSVQLFTRAADGRWPRQDSGLNVPRQDRALPLSVPVFPLSLAEGAGTTLYVRVSSASVLDLTPILWREDAFYDALHESQLMLSLAMGGIGMSGLLSLALCVYFRHPSFLYYALAMGFEIGNELGYSGMLQHYLWPADWPFFLQIRAVIACGAILSFFMFFISCLDTLTAFPRLNRLFRLSLGITLAGTLCGVVYDYRLGVQIWTLALDVTLLLLLAILVLSWRQGSRTAAILLLAILASVGVEALRLAILLRSHSEDIGSIALGPWAILLTAPMVLVELGRLARNMSEEVSAAHRASRAKSDFLARVSHELRSPLNTILGYANMLKRDSGRLTLAEGLQGIESSGKRLLGLIDELLDQSRLQAGRLQLTPVPLDLGRWLDEVQRHGELQALHSQNQFALTRQPPLPEAVVLDGDRLWQVLDNLLTNANRHTHQGRIDMQIHSETVDADRVRLHLAVRDTGIGIEPAEQRRIFEPFFQGRTPAPSKERRRPGVGLGLPIARELVQLMGGELTLESQPGQGSTFRFSVLCARAVRPETPPPEAVSTPVAAPTADTCVLLIDDEAQARQALADLLTHAGMRVIEADGGRAAASHLDQVQAVITDQFMATGDGWSVLQAVRTRRPHLPVVLLSAAQAQAPEGWPVAWRFDAVFSKPCDEAALLRRLQALLAQDTVRALARLSPARRDALQDMVTRGALSDLEDWCAAMAQAHPHDQRLFDSLRREAVALHFTRLQDWLDASRDCQT
jgi:signal transduction histidine kinase/CheY-like chemotaxis protein